MNHRELMQSRMKKARFFFMSLPPDLQDQIIDGLDQGRLTLEAASDLIAKTGVKLSIEAISDYYHAVRRERRLRDLNGGLDEIREIFKDKNLDDNRRALINIAISKVIQGLADGEIGIKDLDVARMMAMLPAEAPAAIPPAQSETQPAANPQSASEKLDQVAEEMYGLSPKK